MKTQEKVSHTPGPWEEGIRNNSGSILIAGGVDTQFAYITEAKSIVILRGVDGNKRTDKELLVEQKANARLIAAAPELLEALKITIDYISDDEEYYQRMTKLIAKAS